MRQRAITRTLPILVVAFLGVAGPVTAQSRDRDNIVIVLDASGSMRERMKGGTLTRMEAAKRALLEVMKQVPESANVGLLVFSGRGMKGEWAYPLGPLDRAKMDAAIRSPQPDGPTPLGTYLKRGADILLEQRKKQQGYGTFRLLVVTDGEATDGNLLVQYLPDVLSRGITVDAIGVDMKEDHTLATRVHSYRRANNPEELAKAVSAVFAEVGSAKDTVADKEAFEIIQAIPDNVAKSMLTALASSGNHPIGEQPPAPAPPSESAPAPTGAPQTSSPSLPTPMPTANGGSKGWWIAIVVIVIVGGWAATRGKQRNRGNR